MNGSGPPPRSSGWPPPWPALDPVPSALRMHLAGRAAQAGLLDLAYRTFDSPVGTLLLAATPAGLVRLGFVEGSEDPLVAQLAERISPRILFAPAPLDPAARQLEEYFEGRRRRFELALDLQLARGFRKVVLGQLSAIPYGATTSYSTLAAGAGSPRAVRAVGTACAANPLPIVIPCHRVLRRDGSLGGYAGGLRTKAALLALEARDPTGRSGPRPPAGPTGLATEGSPPAGP